MEKQKNVIIFGGSFDPPTLAHSSIIDRCLALPSFDEVWVMPSGSRPDKTINVEADRRLEMLEILKRTELADTDRLVISDFELRLSDSTETIRTIGALAIAYPNVSFWHVFGVDSYVDMPNWRGGQELKDSLRMVIVPRAGYDTPAQSKNIRILEDNTSYANVSSTMVREAVANGRTIDDLVSSEIRTYIKSEALYKNQQLKI